MQINAVNSRAFAEGGAVGSNIIRRVEVWGMDPAYTTSSGLQVPIALCRDSTGYIYQVLQASGMGSSTPQPGETWLISRALGLWTFMARVALPSPIVQTLAAGVSHYAMQPSNRFVFAFPASGQSVEVTFPNPITAVQGDVYGFRNTAGGGTGYTGALVIAGFSGETVHGPGSLGAHSGASFVCDNKEWFCVGDTTAASGTEVGGA
jgi:hypothetical protein